MAAGRLDRCSTRTRPRAPERDSHAIAPTSELDLSRLGHAFVEAMRDDERYRDVVDDPFGEEGPQPA